MFPPLKLYRFTADMVVMAESAQDALAIMATTLIAASDGEEDNEGIVDGRCEMKLLQRDS